jgi:hypothetical protein
MSIDYKYDDLAKRKKTRMDSYCPRCSKLPQNANSSLIPNPIFTTKEPNLEIGLS